MTTYMYVVADVSLDYFKRFPMNLPHLPSLLDVYGMDRPELMQALSEMTDDDKLSIQAYLESRGAWTTEIGNQDSREYGEYHLDVRYNTDTDELIDMKERKAVYDKAMEPINADDVVVKFASFLKANGRF